MIGSAIPQVQTITGLIAAVAIMQFTYTFPFILRFGYDVITDAMMEDHLHIAGSGTVARIDTWRDWSRWRRVSWSPLFRILPKNSLSNRRVSSVEGGTIKCSTWVFSSAGCPLLAWGCGVQVNPSKRLSLWAARPLPSVVQLPYKLISDILENLCILHPVSTSRCTPTL